MAVFDDKATLPIFLLFFLLLSNCCVSLPSPTSSSKLWVVRTSRIGCETVTSEEPCPATKLNPELVADYETESELIKITIDDLKRDHQNVSADCTETVRRIYCSKITPRCFENGTRDYENVTGDCAKVESVCPTNSLDNDICDNLITGMQPLSSCVKPSEPINGSCPQPKLKMPKDRLDLYKRASMAYEKAGQFENLTTSRYPNGTRMFSAECAAKIKELYCVPSYCSADDTELIFEYTDKDCENVIDDCFDGIYAELSDGKVKDDLEELREDFVANCVFFPEDDSTDSTAGSGSPLPVDMSTALLGMNKSTTPPGMNETTTPPGMNQSTTPPGMNESTTPPGMNKSTTPPGMSESTTPPGMNKSTIPPGMNETTTPVPKNASTDTTSRMEASTENGTPLTGGKTMSSNPPVEATSLPGKSTGKVEIIETPGPTAGYGKVEISLLLLSLMLLVQF